MSGPVEKVQRAAAFGNGLVPDDSGHRLDGAAKILLGIVWVYVFAQMKHSLHHRVGLGHEFNGAHGRKFQQPCDHPLDRDVAADGQMMDQGKGKQTIGRLPFPQTFALALVPALVRRWI